MAKQGESRVQQRIRKQLKKEVGGWWFKVWGGPFQAAGIPDIIGCVEGTFFAFEVKRPKGKTSPIQISTMEDIIELGGGVTFVITNANEAIAAIKFRLEQVGPVPAERRKFFLRRLHSSLVLRAGNRKDVDRRRIARKTIPPRIRRTVDR